MLTQHDERNLARLTGTSELTPALRAAVERRQKLWHQVASGPVPTECLIEAVLSVEQSNGKPADPEPVQEPAQEPTTEVTELPETPQGDELPKVEEMTPESVPLPEEPEEAPRVPAGTPWPEVPAKTPVLAFWDDKLRGGLFEGTGREGKLRISFSKDEKAYRQIPADQVRLQQRERLPKSED